MRNPAHITSKSKTRLYRVKPAFGGYVIQSRHTDESKWHLADPQVFYNRDAADTTARNLADRH